MTDLPILRKDFTIDPYQLYEAKVYGADAVLLVVGALSDSLLGSLYGIARQLELDAIVEVHDEEELERALAVDADVIGINNRDLVDFTVSLDVTFELLTDVPAGKTVVSESGIVTRADVEELENVGVDAVLVGEALMRAPDPEAACRDLAREEEPTQAYCAGPSFGKGVATSPPARSAEEADGECHDDSARRLQPLGELDDQAFRAADVAEEERVLVVDDLPDRLPSGLPDSVDDCAQVADFEGHVPQPGTVRGQGRLLSAIGRRVEAHHLEHVGSRRGREPSRPRPSPPRDR